MDTAIITWAGWIVAAIGAMFSLRAGYLRAGQEELRVLADTRGDRVKDLEDRVALLEAQVAAITHLKAVEIGDHVVQRLVEMRVV